MIWKCLHRSFDLSSRGEIMGILNVTPDSFSDGGRYGTVDGAVARAAQMIEEGAAILDIGGESTRPGAAEVSVEEEKARVLPVIERLHCEYPEACISVDTSKAEVAAAAVNAGAEIINDVTGFRDPDMIAVASGSGAGVVVMHMQGTPRTMQAEPSYEDVCREVAAFFEDRFGALVAAGVEEEAIVFDPGIGFGKTLEHNLDLLRHPERLSVRDRPLLLGVSRKSFLGTLTGTEVAEDRDWSTVAVTSLAREQGIPLHRVHEVRANVEAIRMTEAMLPGS
jgi:dihydropteroate synthase